MEVFLLIWFSNDPGPLLPTPTPAFPVFYLLSLFIDVAINGLGGMGGKEHTG